MSEKKPQPETSRQYGVTYPDGTTFWVVNTWPSNAGALPGAYALLDKIDTPEDRAEYLAAWRQRLKELRLDPDAVPQPSFVTREIVRSFGDSTEVSD